MQSAWYYDERYKAWYYLNDECKMVRGSKYKPLWVWIYDGCYCFNERGEMYSGCVTPDGFTVDESGAWVK